MLKIFKKKQCDCVFELALVDEEDEIKLCVVDEKGRPICGGYLLLIHKTTKKARRCNRVSGEYGFELERNGNIKIYDE